MNPVQTGVGTIHDKYFEVTALVPNGPIYWCSACCPHFQFIPEYQPGTGINRFSQSRKWHEGSSRDLWVQMVGKFDDSHKVQMSAQYSKDYLANQMELNWSLLTS
ncbi:hypothetical protein DFH28DRAFT_936355 [Melampsora americana]|nr:hypothetical protein DFH28DRAFT_936355 [Melampsora americana]